MQSLVGKPIQHPSAVSSIIDRYKEVRMRTVELCRPLEPEDMVVQPIEFVSPAKWHLAHSTWFFETFFLQPNSAYYRLFDENYSFLFNSYYESIGNRVIRADRGNVTRPGVKTILKYRKYVDEHVEVILSNSELTAAVLDILELGLQHEMQHQELLLSDIKYILGHNPIFPAYSENAGIDEILLDSKQDFIEIREGLYPIGFKGEGFSFDNEHGAHKQFVHNFQIATRPINFGEYLEFIESGAYSNFKHWHADAWAYIIENNVQSPMYMHKEQNQWYRYTLTGYKKIVPQELFLHCSFYEAAAFANWKGMRLPTEFEWEVASTKMAWGECWEHCNSAYLPYPGFKTAEGALGEYNGKFMINQMVLRGASKATFPGHSRHTYRNFFHPQLQWQFAGVRLAR